ncbi:uncharacterized protein LOC135350739 [Halichondria panicea]|uniref:uncharacterized protein LOC135350739 n=1 Tax=Halichondria panicea TaxID=6063 RepID=UPI00312BB87F
MMETDSSFAQETMKVLGRDWIYLIDSGGQPQFHNLLPHFIEGLSTILIVIRLSEKLDNSPTVEYYENGASTGSHQSPLSIIDTLKCLIRSLQSYKISDQKSKLVFIGTFYDQITDTDSLTEKNQQLYDLFSEECLDQLVFRNSAKNELIFPINGKLPCEPEKEIARQIRSLIESIPAQFESEIPSRWNMLEVFMEYTSTCLQRKVLSRAECLELAQKLKFKISDSEDELTNALRHFHNMHLLHYYPQILPDVVFTSPQVILDEITALVKEVYRVRDSSGATIVVDYQLRRGIITTASLSKFQRHIVEGIFGPTELQKLFIGLLIVTPISSSQDKNDHSNKKFFMPALLHMIPSADLEMYRVFEPIQPLLISFESGLPRSGVFCCLQVYLMKELKWKLVYTNTEPKIIAQNCVMLAHPREPCTITIIDSFSYIEAYVSSKPENYRRVLPLIRESILDGIKAANQALQYTCHDEDQPRLTFFCPCNQEVSANPPQRHIGKVKEGNEIQCSVQQQSYFDLNEKYTKWLGPVISGKLLQALFSRENTCGIYMKQYSMQDLSGKILVVLLELSHPTSIAFMQVILLPIRTMASVCIKFWRDGSGLVKLQ